MSNKFYKEKLTQEVKTRAWESGYEKGEIDFEKENEYNDDPPSLTEIREMYELSDFHIDENSEDMQEQIDFAYQVFYKAYKKGYGDGWDNAEEYREKRL